MRIIHEVLIKNVFICFWRWPRSRPMWQRRTAPQAWHGPATAKYRSLAAVFDWRTNRWPCLAADQLQIGSSRWWWPDVVGRHAVNALILHDGHKIIRCLTGSHNNGVMWSNFLAPAMSPTAAICITCRWLRSQLGRSVNIASKYFSRGTTKHVTSIVSAQLDKLRWMQRTDLPQITKTGRHQATDMVTHEQCRVMVQSAVFHGRNTLDGVESMTRLLLGTWWWCPDEEYQISSVFDVLSLNRFNNFKLGILKPFLFKNRLWRHH